MNKYEHRTIAGTLLFRLPVLQAGSDTFTALAILIVAIGIVGLAILILFSRKKI